MVKAVLLAFLEEFLIQQLKVANALSHFYGMDLLALKFNHVQEEKYGMFTPTVANVLKHHIGMAYNV